MTLDQNRLDEVRYALFNTTAPRYNKLIMPAFGPLAERLVDLAELTAQDVVARSRLRHRRGRLSGQPTGRAGGRAGLCPGHASSSPAADCGSTSRGTDLLSRRYAASPFPQPNLFGSPGLLWF